MRCDKVIHLGTRSDKLSQDKVSQDVTKRTGERLLCGTLAPDLNLLLLEVSSVFFVDEDKIEEVAHLRLRRDEKRDKERIRIVSEVRYVFVCACVCVCVCVFL